MQASLALQAALASGDKQDKAVRVLMWPVPEIYLILLARAHATAAILRHGTQVLLHPERTLPHKVHLEELEELGFLAK